MESQLFDQFLEDIWSADACESKSANTTSDLWPNDLWLNQYNPHNPPAHNFEDFQILNDLEFDFKPCNSSSPPEFGQSSPVSDSSSLCAEDPFDQKSLIDPWVIPTAFDNTSTPNAPCNSPFEEDFPAISIPGFASSPGSSESNSPSDVEAKRPRIPARKRRVEKSQAKSPPCLKRQNTHNLIEKRYRNNLNTKINALRDSIPSLRFVKKESEDGEDGMDSDAGESRRIQKCNKGIILDKAIQYITELEKEVERLSKEKAGLQLMIKGGIPNYLMLGLRR